MTYYFTLTYPVSVYCSLFMSKNDPTGSRLSAAHFFSHIPSLNVSKRSVKLKRMALPTKRLKNRILSPTTNIENNNPRVYNTMGFITANF